MAAGLMETAIPDRTLHYQVQAKYSIRPGMSANEAFLSKSAYERYGKGIKDPRYKAVGFTHAPGKDEFLSTSIKYATREGGRDFAHNEPWTKREKRFRSRQAKGTGKFIAGASIRLGVPVLIYGAMGFEFYQRYQEGGFEHAIDMFSGINIAYDVKDTVVGIGSAYWQAATWMNVLSTDFGEKVHGLLGL